MKVQTTQGLIERALLQVRDEVMETETARITVTRWFLDDEEVRRDSNVNILRGFEVGINGN